MSTTAHTDVYSETAGRTICQLKRQPEQRKHTSMIPGGNSPLNVSLSSLVSLHLPVSFLPFFCPHFCPYPHTLSPLVAAVILAASFQATQNVSSVSLLSLLLSCGETLVCVPRF